ncbi:MAG TPA: phosphoglucosamine mutase [Bryobacteraceae bacterium]|nr:phosphoglucosamine mutase [Bryobacteraceae bacterium]
MPRQLFGTDGIRGIAGEFPLDRKTAHAVGNALGRWSRQHAEAPEVLIGMDTRESGPWLAAEVAGGLERHGVRTRFAGLITTPGVAYLTRTSSFVAGVMISASHNPYHDNGIKVFDHSGFKLPDSEEHLLENDIFAAIAGGLEPSPLPLSVDEGLDRAYLDYLVSTIAVTFPGKKVVLDCANGAASYLGPELFRRLGAEVLAIHCEPTGRNINLNCGALHVESLREAVMRAGAHAGVAFDGDADRAILVSGSGKTIDGDSMLLVAANALQQAGRLQGSNGEPVVIATVMSNLGLERALSGAGISMVRTPVGDKYVLEEMIRRGALLGGEQSGHVIFREFATTGDGLLTALQVLSIVEKTGLSLDQLTGSLEIYPQILVNVRIGARKPLADLPAVQQEIRDAEESFGDAGRVLVRFSGTEPLARVMVEGPDLDRVERFAGRIAGAIRTELGVA